MCGRYYLFLFSVYHPTEQLLLAAVGAQTPALYTHSRQHLNLSLTLGFLGHVLMLSCSNTQLPLNSCLGLSREEAERERRVEKFQGVETCCALVCSV